MSQTNSLNTTPNASLSLEQRRALLWVKKNQPTAFPALNKQSPAARRALIDLVRLGLISLDPMRKAFDPPLYVMTDKGKAAL